jgi:beta-glucosidase/6-phospho-beta-glucosidase/beta-galactosidase
MSFSPEFLWGVATAGYQVEGGIDNNDWAHFVGDPQIVERVHGIGAFDGYDINLTSPGDALNHQNIDIFKADLDRAIALGATAYRMSIEWSRVQPSAPESGAARWLDPEGVEFYAQRIEAVLARGMVLHVTLNHLTLPAWVLTPPVTSTHVGAYGVIGPRVAIDDSAYREHPGWEGDNTPQLFANYAAAVVQEYHTRFAGREIFWATFNEPVGSLVGVGYFAGIWPPGFTFDGGRGRTAYFNILRAHILAYDAMKEVSGDAAQIGIVHNIIHTQRTITSPAQSTAQVGFLTGTVIGGVVGAAVGAVVGTVVGLALCGPLCALAGFVIGLIAGAIVGAGIGAAVGAASGAISGAAVDYHELARQKFDYFYHEHLLNALILFSVDMEISAAEGGRRILDIDAFIREGDDPGYTHGGLPRPPVPNASRLDFLGINYYRTAFIYHDAVFASRVPYAGGVFKDDLRVTSEPRILVNDLGWGIHPDGLAQIITRIHRTYSRPGQPLPILISENGCPESADKLRAPYVVAHLEALERAMQEDDPVLGRAKVLGYFHWTLADNYEWQHGFEENSRFGLFSVDRQFPNERRITEAALAFHVLARSRDPALARTKFGSIEPTLPNVILPSSSPGGRWVGGVGSERARLWLTPIDAIAVEGMFYYPDRNQWIRLNDVHYDSALGRIALSHGEAAGVPARNFLATVTAAGFESGVCTDSLPGGGRLEHVWHAPRDPLVGIWVPTAQDLAGPRSRDGGRQGWRMLSLECWDDYWRAKILWETCSWESIGDMHVVTEDDVTTLTWLTSYGGFIAALVVEPAGNLLRGVCAASAIRGDTFLFEAARMPDGLPF